MKKTIMVLVMVFTTMTMFSKNISGKWNGTLDINGTKLHIVFNIKKILNVVTVTMDSPDQNAYGIKASKAEFENSTLKIEISNANLEYLGTLNENNTFVGVVKQSGAIFPAILTKEAEN